MTTFEQYIDQHHNQPTEAETEAHEAWAQTRFEDACDSHRKGE